MALLAPVLHDPPYFVSWTPDYPNHDIYPGRVLETRLGPFSWDRDRSQMEPGDSVRRLLRTDPLEMRFIAGPATRNLAPIVALLTREREIILLGASGDDLVYRYWGAADELRLDHADLRIPDVFTHVTVGDTLDLAFDFSIWRYCLQLNEELRCARAFTVADTWSVLISPDWNHEASSLVGLAWLWAVFLPSGYVARSWRVLLAVTTTAASLVAIGPLLAESSPSPLLQVVAAALGTLSGFGVGALALRSLQPKSAPMPRSALR
jgi:hypothetical protein